MTGTPLVSVCVPTYNYARFLPQCIESVLAQTLADWEMVITDDASTDDTEAVVMRYARRDPRIRYVKNPERLGMTANLGRAASLGRGRYLKMLCADDWLAPSCLATLHGLMEANPGVVLATSAEIHCEADGSPLWIQFLFGRPLSLIAGETMLDRMAAGDGFGGNSSFCIRAAAYHRVGGYDPRVRYASDYDLAARLCRVGDYVHTDEPLFFGRRHPAASSAVDPATFVDVVDLFSVPARLFQPRRLGNREWRRYHRRRTALTAQYLVTAAVARARGHHEFARTLLRLVLDHGNLWLGVPWLLGHLPRRAVSRLRRAGASVPRRPPAAIPIPGVRL
jgi:glycosyltransferase involved in cell wall biosynthesis